MRRKKFLAVLVLMGLMITVTAACGSTSVADSSSIANTEKGSEGGEETEEESNNSGTSLSDEITLEDVMNAPESPAEDFGTITSADGECQINEYYGTDEIVVVPSEIDGEKVVSIGKYVFANDYTETVRAIRLPDSVVSMERGWAFCNNKVLEIFVAGTGLEIIGEDSFLNCSSLKTVVLNEGLIEIGDLAFVNCTSLAEITIPSTVDTMSNGCIYFVADDFVMYGLAGSVAESYAELSGFTFISTGEASTESESSQAESPEQSGTTDPTEISINWSDSGLLYWLSTRDWGETKDLTNVNFYANSLTLPIELNQFDTVVSSWSCESNYYDSMDEVMADSSITVDPGDTTIIWEQTSVESIEEIRIENHSDEALSVGECYKNGWWYLYNELDISEMFLFDSDSWSGDDLINAIVDYAGAPSYILTSSRFVDNFESDEEGTTIAYNLVYEYDDFVFCIFANEKLASEEDHETNVRYVYYYPVEEWNTLELTSYEVTQIADVNGVELRLYTR